MSSAPEDLRQARTMLRVAGVLGVLAGLGAIAVPAVASVGTAIFIGIVLLVASIPLAVEAFAAPDLGRKLLRLVVAALTAIAGIYLLAAPLEGTYTLTVMLVIWFVAIGFARLAGGLAHLGAPGAGLSAFSGLVSIVLGILIAERAPELLRLGDRAARGHRLPLLRGERPVDGLRAGSR